MSTEEFRRHAHLRAGARVDHDTVNRALAGVLKHYQGQERLEAEIKLEAEEYDTAIKKTDFHFSASQGPQVKVLVEGASMSPERIKHVIPVFEEGTVDDDLLNEGNRRLRDYYQRLGFLRRQGGSRGATYRNREGGDSLQGPPGARRRVERVSVVGNRYFDSATLKELLNVHAADSLDRHGAYSQALVSADVSALQAVYQNNGFSKVKIVPETSTPETSAADPSAPVTAPAGGKGSAASTGWATWRSENRTFSSAWRPRPCAKSCPQVEHHSPRKRTSVAAF